jgi:glycosyltransferase involved in cell wall biosynthesis
MDKRSWSGTYFRMGEQLKQEFVNVVFFGPVKLSRYNYYKMQLELLVSSITHKVFYQKRFNRLHNHIRSRYHSSFFDEKIKATNIDVLFAPAASVEIAHLKTDIPICYFSDATFKLLYNYYDSLGPFSSKSVKISNEIEFLAINKSITQVYPSSWAINSAKEDYHARHPFLVKLGANIDENPDIEDIIKQYDSDINILFVGVDWKRKGGDIALETIDYLDKKGYKVHLTVCGCIPPRTHPRMTVIPFLDKNKQEDMLKFKSLFYEAHLFFMPTRAECFGVVFCEANAYGLPVITTDTGGTSSVIEDGVNGFILPESATSEAYAHIIMKLIDDKELFRKMSNMALQKYEEELNWTRWGKEMKKILVLTKKLAQ